MNYTAHQGSFFAHRITLNGGKPWAYVLIPDDQILANASLAGLSAKFAAG